MLILDNSLIQVLINLRNEWAYDNKSNWFAFLNFYRLWWVDVFTREIYKKVLIDSLKYCIAHKGLKLHAYVIMSNHMHIIISSQDGFRLSDSIRDFKKFTSKTIVKLIMITPEESRSEWILRLFKYYAKFNKNNEKYQFWKRDNKPIELVSPKWINQKLSYTHNNPVRSGIVEDPEDYTSASWYKEETGKVEISKLILDNSIGYVVM
jgi:REP element-mobilizing transposase RayT